DTERAGQPQIEVLQTIAAERVSSCIAECVDRVDLPRGRIPRRAVPSCSVCQQRAWVEPAVRAGIVDVPVADNVGTVRTNSCIACIACIALVSARKNREGRTRLKTEY